MLLYILETSYFMVNMATWQTAHLTQVQVHLELQACYVPKEYNHCSLNCFTLGIIFFNVLRFYILKSNLQIKSVPVVYHGSSFLNYTSQYSSGSLLNESKKDNSKHHFFSAHLPTLISWVRTIVMAIAWVTMATRYLILLWTETISHLSLIVSSWQITTMKKQNSECH